MLQQSKSVKPIKTATIIDDIRLLIPVFLLKKLQVHPLTSSLYPVSLGKHSGIGYQINKNNSDHHSLLYCQSTSAILDYKSKSREVKSGDLVIMPANTSFKFTAIDTDTKNELKNKSGKIYWLNFTGDLASNFAERLLMKMDDGLAHVGNVDEVIEDFDNLLALGRRGYTATNVIHAVHVLQQTLSFLALQLRLTDFNNSSAFDIDAVERLMRNNLHQELSLDTLAHYSQLSKFHFSKKFKELTDTSPIQHFINMKIQRACFALDNSSQTIKDISESLGYSDPYYFSRLFKKSLGMSPKQYRDSRHSS
ncbi:helix-turn-helix domain-containing protein [Colwellia hornerae]|uniref:Helix-turn-helix transcriptional regulator n=1 Tax=Colwellia hornerae TaxID=89402 RepID=A0A5C6QNC1_9GAMM|nr:AraC family transcriptional regulator [Colwellia hornerae]TWX54666.1 helix-turn-helix transcriptional regulator [Colwellia hornerae]TWX61106.1 helix-turn-helix transcriptional regulator [Colwellia hornerae]TWX70359.1 helix-turn-helix transcriptional regulator [Colwellia hornerae]